MFWGQFSGMENPLLVGEDLFSSYDRENKNKKDPICLEEEETRTVASDGNVSEEDEECVAWDEGGSLDEDRRITLGLVGKVWTERFVNPNAFISTMKGIWRFQHGVEINNIRNNLFNSNFTIGRIRRKFLGGNPVILIEMLYS